MAGITLVFVMLIAGFLFKRFKAFPQNSAQVLNQYIIYVSLPAVVLYRMPELKFSRDLLAVVAIPYLLLIATTLLIGLLTWVFRWDKRIAGGLLLLASLGNTSFLGIPMVDAYFGADHIKYAILYDQFGSFFLLSLFAPVVIAFTGGGNRLKAGEILKRIVTFPPFIALVIALLLRGWAYPPVVTSVLSAVSGTLVPVVMFAVGLMMNLRIDRHHVMPLTAGLLIKLLISPFIAFLLCRVLGFEGEPVRIAIFESAMPPMITAGAVAISAGLVPELMASMVGIGLILSFLTLPSVYYMLQLFF